MLRHLLIVDDNESDHLLSKYIIEDYDENISISTAYDGKKALDILASTADSIDCILLDINMPGMNGLDFLEEYSKLSYSSLIVAMLTTSLQEKDREICSSYECVKMFLDKPISVENMKELSSLVESERS